MGGILVIAMVGGAVLFDRSPTPPDAATEAGRHTQAGAALPERGFAGPDRSGSGAPPIEGIASAMHGFRAIGGVARAGGPTYAAEVASGRLRYVATTVVDRGGERRRLVAPPLDLRTEGLGRGQASTVRESAIRLRPQGSVGLDRGTGVEETFDAGPRGVEQSWHFRGRPEGDGDLVVRVAFEGLSPTRRDETGWLFADASTGLGVRYGHGTWIDDEGRRTSVPAELVGGAIELRVPARVVAASTYPCVLDPTITTEFGLGPAGSQGAEYTQDTPAIACDPVSHQCLVAWFDYRGLIEPNGMSDIYAARIASNGMLLDPGGLPIGRATDTQEQPEVAFGAGKYLVAWTDFRNGQYARVYGALVPVDTGSAVGAAFQIGYVMNQNCWFPAVSFDGSSFAVFFQYGLPASADIWGIRVNATTGALVEAAPVSIISGNGGQLRPRAVFDGTNHYVVWRDTRGGSGSHDVYGARVSTLLGSAEGAGGVPIASGAGNPDVATDGSTTLVVFETPYSSSGSDVVGQRITASTGVLNGAAISVASSANTLRDPSVAFDGTDFHVVYADSGANGNLRGREVATSGAVLGTMPYVVWNGNGQGALPSLAWNGTDVVAAFRQDPATGDQDIRAMRITTSGTQVDPSGTLVSRASDPQRSPSIAFDGTNFLYVFDMRVADGTSDVYGAFVRGSDFAPIGDPFLIAGGTKDQFAPEVAFDGTNYLVVFSSNAAGSNIAIYGARVTTSGTVLDTSGFAISNSTGNCDGASVVYDGTQFVVVWGDFRAGMPPMGGDVYGARVGTDGTVLDTTNIAICTTANSLDNRPSLAVIPASGPNPAKMIVVWQSEAFPPATTSTDLYGATLASNGAVGAITPIVVANLQQYGADVATDGTDFMIVYAEGDGSGNEQPWALRVSATLSPQGSSFSLATPTPGSTMPRIAHGGVEYLVTFDRRVDQPAPADDYDELRATRLSNTGTIRDAGGLLVASRIIGNQPAAIGVMPVSRYLLGFPRYVVDPGFGSIRVRGVGFLAEKPTGQPCLVDAECQNGQCEDGICCATDCGNSSEGDCRACSVAAGAPANGTCANVTAVAMHECRPAVSGCDVAEVCSGSSNTCPATDLAAPPGTTCGPALVGDCDALDECSGSVGATATCVSKYASASTVCRASTDTSCDPQETCTGSSDACPADVTSCSGTADAGVDGGSGTDSGMGGDSGTEGDGSVDYRSRPSATLCSAGSSGGGTGAPAVLAILAVLGLLAARRMGRWSLLVAALSLAFALPAASAVAQSSSQDPEAIARAQFQLGQLLYNEGRFAEAATAFQAAYDASHRPQLLYNLYVAHRDAGQLEQAADALRRYIDSGQEADTAVLRGRLTVLEQQVEDRRRAEEARHQEEAAAAATAASASTTTSATPAEAAPPPTPPESRDETRPNRGLRIAGYSLIGLGAAGIATFVGGAVGVGNQESALDPYCGEAIGQPSGVCLDNAQVDDVDSKIATLRAVSFTGLAVGVASAAAGTFLVIRAGRTETRAAAACLPGACEVGVHVRF